MAPPSLEVIPQTLLTFEGEMAPKTASSVPFGSATSPGWPACQPESAEICGPALPAGEIDNVVSPVRELPTRVWKTRCRFPSAERAVATACAAVPLTVARRVNGTFGVNTSACRGVLAFTAVMACAAAVPTRAIVAATANAIRFLGIGTPFVRRSRRGDRALEDSLERNLRPLRDLADGGGSSLELAEDDLVGLQQDRAQVANGLAAPLQGGRRGAEALVERLQVVLDDPGPVALAHEADSRCFHHDLDARTAGAATKEGKPYEIGWRSRASSARASWARERIPSLR